MSIFNIEFGEASHIVFVHEKRHVDVGGWGGDEKRHVDVGGGGKFR